MPVPIGKSTAGARWILWLTVFILAASPIATQMKPTFIQSHPKSMVKTIGKISVQHDTENGSVNGSNDNGSEFEYDIIPDQHCGSGTPNSIKQFNAV